MRSNERRNRWTFATATGYALASNIEAWRSFLLLEGEENGLHHVDVTGGKQDGNHNLSRQHKNGYLLGRLALNEARQSPACKVHKGLHGQRIRSAGQLAQAPRVQTDELLIKYLALLQASQSGFATPVCAGARTADMLTKTSTFPGWCRHGKL